MKQLYINGKQATIWQKALFTLATIGFFLLIIPFGLGILAIGMILTGIFYVYLYFKVRKIKQMMNVQEQMFKKAEPAMKNRQEGVIDGEYKEL